MKEPTFSRHLYFSPRLKKMKVLGDTLGVFGSCLTCEFRFLLLQHEFNRTHQTTLHGDTRRFCKGSSFPETGTDVFLFFLSLVTSLGAKISMIIPVFTSNERPLNPFENIATPSEVEAAAHACIRIQNGVQRKGSMDMVASMTFHLKKCPVLQIILSFVE